MKPATAAAMATALEQLAAALREEATETVQPTRRRVSLVAKEKGISASTLYELIARKEITAARVGLKRGTYLVDPADVEEYIQRNTTRARRIREVAAVAR